MRDKIKDIKGRKAKKLRMKFAHHVNWDNGICQDIAFLTLNYIENILVKNNILFNSGDIDEVIRVMNRITFKVHKKRCTCFKTRKPHPLSTQRQIIFNKYPEIFPRKKE